MSNPKRKITLTDLQVHAKDFRSASSLEKADKTGRFFGPPALLMTQNPDGSFTIGFDLKSLLPKDVLEGIAKGDTVVETLKHLPLSNGKDMDEKLKQIEKKKTKQLIHRSRGKTWHKKDEGVK